MHRGSLIVFAVILTSIVGVASTTDAQNLVALFSVSGDRQIGTINPTDGSVSLMGSPINGGSLSTSGGSAYDPAANTLYFVANVAGQTLYTAALPTPAITTHVMTTTGALGLEYDGALLVGFFSVSGDRQIGTVNAADGTVTLLGSPINGGNLSTSANSTINIAGGRLYFAGSPSPSNTNTIYSVNTATGVATGAAITPDTAVALMIYDQTAGVLRALFNIGGGRRLGTIDPATGAVVLAPNLINGGASISTSSDTIALSESTNELFFVGTPNGGNLSVFTVDTTDGSATAQELPAGTSAVSLEYDPGSVPVMLERLSID